MTGARSSATRATARIPPKTTGAVRRTRITAEPHTGTPCPESSVAAIVFAWTISNAKPKTKMRRTAKTAPQPREPRPRWM